MKEKQNDENKNLTINGTKQDSSEKMLQKAQKSEEKRSSRLRRKAIPSYLQITADDKLIVRSSQVCKIFGISDRTLSTWTARGAPQYKRGWWDLAVLIEWRIKSAGFGRTDGGTTNEAKKLNADARLKEVKADIEEMRLERMMERLVPLEMVEEEMTACFANARSGLLRIGEKVFTELHAQYPEIMHDVRRIVNYEIETGLDRLSESKFYKR